MSDEVVTLVYLEADDEITGVVRRVRASPAGRVVVVAPGRSRATSSAVALRLLARVGEAEGRQVVVVGDALTRSLAAEAGLPAFAAADEARTAALDGVPPRAEGQRHAAIRVVRGPAADDTVATAAPATPASVVRPADTDRSAGPIGSFDETRAVAVATPVAGARARGGRSRRPSRTLAVVLGVAAALLVAAVVAGATLLPAATVVVRPIPVTVTATYELRVTELSAQPGEVEATSVVTATKTYEEHEPATGAAAFRNFNTVAVEVPAGTLVATGTEADDQAFETSEAIVVPAGSLTADGRISAGEASAAIVAAAPGPAGNVGAEAIDTVLSQGVAARLRGFPQNAARLVINAEPTAGGVDASGPEITQEDVDAAVATLRADLRRLADAERLDPGSRILLERPPSDAVVELPDDLVGRRDQPEVEISGTLAWEQVIVDPEPLIAEAEGRLAADPDVPADHELLSEETSVTLSDARLDGDEAVVRAEVVGRAAPDVDADGIRALIAGLTEMEAELALATFGEVDVTLWPGWVTAVPERDWRVEVRIEEASP